MELPEIKKIEKYVKDNLMPHTSTEQCDCKETSCPKGCTTKHTHKTFFCEVCNPPDVTSTESIHKPYLKCDNNPCICADLIAQVLKEATEEQNKIMVTSTEEEVLRDFDNEFCCDAPEGGRIVAFHDTGSDREVEFDFWNDYKIKNYILKVRQEAIAQEREELRDKILNNWTADLCTNSQEFRHFVLSHLTQ